MDRKFVVSIGRQFGSGGRVIGKAIAKKFGIDYFDNELITLAAKKYGLNPEVFKKADEKSDKGFILQFFEEYISGGAWSVNWLSNDKLFEMQSEVIKRISEEKSCVIVGRCSDYVLRNNPNCISIFLHSSDEDRVKRIRSRMGGEAPIDDEKVIKLMREADKRRANYYNFYSDKEWGKSSTYTLSLDVSALGEVETIDFLSDFIEKKLSL